MKIFAIAVLLLEASSCSAFDNVEPTYENRRLRRNSYVTQGTVGDHSSQHIAIAANDCPNSYTIDPNTGYPTYMTNTDCECTGVDAGYTVKEDVGAALGEPGSYRCSKPGGEVCASDFECDLDTACSNGTCGMFVISTAANECPNSYEIDPETGWPEYLTILPGTDCECTGADPGYTVKEDVGAALGEPGSYRCSKASGEACASDFECEVDVNCSGGTCGNYSSQHITTAAANECPNSYTIDPNTGYPTYMASTDCECTGVDGYTVKEDIGAPKGQPGNYRCSKPGGEACTSDFECLEGVNCSGGMCELQ